MAIVVYTDKPAALLESIKKAVQDGTVETWSVDADGDFTHTPEQWVRRAWFRPRIEQDRIRFNVLTPKGTKMSRGVYAVFHGRLIEMLLAHFDLRFSRAVATALPVNGDAVGG
jgi:hypothetical protein